MFKKITVFCLVLTTLAAFPSRSNAAEAAGDYRVLNGPGGRQLIEVPMPPGFEPIRLVGLRGIPVTGHPVQERTGELNPENWEQLDLGEIDVNLMRLIDSLRLRSEPRLLQGLSFAEGFARRHLDEESSKTFFVSDSVGAFGTNEFDRKALFEKFLAQYDAPLRGGLPGVPFEFLFIEQVLLGTYDSGQGLFPISGVSGGTETIRLQLFSSPALDLNPPRVEVPATLPMPPKQAEALLARVPDRRGHAGQTAGLSPIRYLYRGMRLAITGFAVAMNGQTDTRIEVRSVGLYEDPLLTRPVHEYETAKEQTAGGAVSLDASLFLPHLPNLYAMRDVEGYLDDEGVARSSRYVINLEQAHSDSPFNLAKQAQCEDKLSSFEWASARPELANGPLLDVLMKTDPDWSFLNAETRFGLLPDHCVELVVFPREKLAGRQVDFAAAELAPVYRRSLEAAIARLPEKVYITRRLTKPVYDHTRKVLRFEDPQAGYVPGQRPELLGGVYRLEYLAPGQDPKGGSSATVVAPKSAEGMAFYSLENAVGDNVPVIPPPTAPKSTIGGEHSRHGSIWRDSVRWFRGERRDEPIALALDRRLPYPAISADPSTAERLIAAHSAYDNALRAVIVISIDGVRTAAPGQRGILFARLERVVVATHEGGEIAVLDAASFPDAVTAYRQGRAEEQAVKEAAASAAAEKEAARQASIGEANATREAGLAACDSASATAQARYECYRAFCASRQRDYECFKRVQHSQIQADAETAEAAGRSATHRSGCMLHARRKWKLTETSSEYAGVIDNCLAQTKREVYGPDILGLRLGMQRNDADLIRRRELSITSGRMRHAAESRLFDESTIYFSADETHLLAIHNMDNLGRPLAAVIGRRIHFGSEGQSVKALLAPMVEKYGSPAWRDDRNVVWSFDQAGTSRKGASFEKCGKLAGLLTDSQWNAMSGPDDRLSNLAPPTASATVDRSDYAALADCGVVLIARLGWLPNGAVGDASFIMLDPAWIAEQPDIAFSNPNEKQDGLRF